MSRLQHITFNTDTGGNQTITVQDYDDINNLEFFGEPHQSISGVKYTHIRGQRKNVRLSYRACIEQDEFRTLFNNITNDLFVKGLASVRYSEGQTMSDTHELIPTERMAYKSEYAMRNGLFMPVMEFTGKDLLRDVTIKFLDYRFVNEAVTQALDYGLITEAVTTSDDYGVL